MRVIVIAMASWLLPASAMAAGQAANEVMPDDRGSLPPGGLSVSDVAGKWLLDANGVEIGRIAGAGKDDDIVVLAADGRKLSVTINKLSLGNGPNTVIESGNSEADALNRMAAGRGGENP